jgi:hypothetical protein
MQAPLVAVAAGYGDLKKNEDAEARSNIRTGPVMVLGKKHGLPCGILSIYVCGHVFLRVSGRTRQGV